MSKPPLKGSATASNEGDKFYRQWGYETIKTNITTVNEVFKVLITINAALLGGGAAFLHESSVSQEYRISILLAFFLSLIMAFVGIYPKTSRVDVRVPSEIKSHKISALNKKRLFLKISLAATLFGLFISMISVFDLGTCI